MVKALLIFKKENTPRHVWKRAASVAGVSGIVEALMLVELGFHVHGQVVQRKWG